jgi:hypothetical protein
MDFCVAIEFKILPLFCFREHNCRGWKRAAIFLIKCNIFNILDSFILPVNNVGRRMYML